MKKLFLLLFIIIILGLAYLLYMISSPFQSASSIKIDLPQKEKTVQNQDEILMVYVKPDTYTTKYKSVENSNTNLTLLLKQFQELNTSKPNQQVKLIANKDINYTRLMQALNSLKETGWTNIQVISH